MNERIVILSDLHLGRPKHAARSAAALRPLWDGAGRLILNGDVAEVHHPKHRVQAARQACRLLELCEQDGVEVTLLSGNHDPFISDHRALELADRDVFVTHGDVFHPAIAPWSPNAARMREAHHEAMKALSPEPITELEARLSASQHASRAEWESMEKQAAHSSIGSMLLRPWAIVQVLSYWRRFPNIVAEFAKEYDIPASIIIVGHTHREGVWKVEGRTVINTGSYGFPGRPLGVVIVGRDVCVHAIRFSDDRGAYQFDETPLERFSIPSEADATQVSQIWAPPEAA